MAAEDEIQAAVDNAFTWVRRVYRESHALLNEATEALRQHGMDSWERESETFFGADTAYLIVRYFSTRDEMEADRAVDLFLGVSLYPDTRHPRGTGACVVAGTSKRSRSVIPFMGKVVNAAARAPKTDDLFRIVSAPDDPVIVCLPDDAGRKAFPGIDEVRSAIVPLTRFRSSSDLDSLANALVDMRNGDEGVLRELLVNVRGTT